MPNLLLVKNDMIFPNKMKHTCNPPNKMTELLWKKIGEWTTNRLQANLIPSTYPRPWLQPCPEFMRAPVYVGILYPTSEMVLEMFSVVIAGFLNILKHHCCWRWHSHSCRWTQNLSCQRKSRIWSQSSRFSEATFKLITWEPRKQTLRMWHSLKSWLVENRDSA